MKDPKVDASNKDNVYTYEIQDTVCGGNDTLELTYSQAVVNPPIVGISAVSTVTRSTNCMKNGPIVFTEKRACGNLVLQASDAELSDFTKLMKAELKGKEAKRLTNENQMGCSLDLDKEGQMACSWDISGDPDTDSGTTVDAHFAKKNGAYVLVGWQYGDKLD